MEITDKHLFLEHANDMLGTIYDWAIHMPSLVLETLPSEETVLIMVDMVNGFAREGALHSSRIERLIPIIAELSRICDERGIVKLALGDAHTQDSPEFGAYPVHCLVGTFEGEIVDALKKVGGYTLIAKNSTNGFLEPAFGEWLNKNERIVNFIITGDCTDICVMQLAMTLKAWFNRENRQARIIVPAYAVETYDSGIHQADLMNLTALYMMAGAGVETVGNIIG